MSSDSQPLDPYAVLGVERGAHPEEIRRAYRQRARELHPDLSGLDAKAMAAANAAWRVLGDPARRTRYHASENTSLADEFDPANEPMVPPPSGLRLLVAALIVLVLVLLVAIVLVGFTAGPTTLGPTAG